jgi:hypothetical protein
MLQNVSFLQCCRAEGENSSSEEYEHAYCKRKVNIKQLTISDHPHVLKWSQGLAGHVCDLCGEHTEFDGYSCRKSCDFDVCMECVAKSDEEIKKS